MEAEEGTSHIGLTASPESPDRLNESDPCLLLASQDDLTWEISDSEDGSSDVSDESTGASEMYELYSSDDGDWEESE